MSADLRGCNFDRTNFTGANLRRAVLFEASLCDAVLHSANGVGADFRKVTLTHCDLREGLYSTADFSYADLTKASLKSADLSYATCHGVHFFETNAEEVNCDNADLSHSTIVQANLTRAKLSVAHMDDCLLTATVFDGCKAHRLTLRKSNAQSAIMAGIDLTEADLSGSNFSGSKLDSAHFERTNIQRAYFPSAHLVGVRMIGVHAQEADFSHADLRKSIITTGDFRGCSFTDADLSESALGGCSFIKADLRRAKLIGTEISQTDFADSTFGFTVLSNVDLRTAANLDKVHHAGPSTLGFDSLFLSHGCVPDEFLRGTGTPDGVIAYLKSLVEQPIQFYSCFISYSTEDQDFASRLYNDLQAFHVRCWFAPHDIQGGKKIYEQIDEAIRIYDRLLLILSNASMASEWVKTEISNARQREIREQRQMLFPIGLVPFQKIRDWRAFDADIGKDSAREVREYFIPDFSNWKDQDRYKEAFQRLLRDLKAENEQ